MKKAQTWIITCFYLQLLLFSPLVKAQNPCGNPVTDDVNDIKKLVDNLPNDYRITLKYVEKMDSLPNHCWLHLMVPELTNSLNNLLQKFNEISDMSDVLSNYSIINNLTRIIYDIMACLSPKNKNFIKQSDYLYKEVQLFPEDFFEHFYNTIEVYKAVANKPEQNECVLLSTTETPRNESRVTKPFLLPPVAASSLRNESSGYNSNKEALGLFSSPSLQGISITLTSLVTLFVGFILGALCWKRTTRRHTLESDRTAQSDVCQEDNEISMLQQKEKSLLQV
ncbi:PREDICTED: kit ligand [Gekko japonicus]|uniref:Kit ligand n=1 Tax=Gekko japonicus TaxID=146911 RepID=A0ABM1L0X5_GEKJA|nr:PREDICTED: kit ligand [Gekko japonicus]